MSFTVVDETHSPQRRGTSPPCRTVRVDADAETIGHIAHQADVPLIELRTADGAGLEEMFLELTADTQRAEHTRTPPTPEGAVA